MPIKKYSYFFFCLLLCTSVLSFYSKSYRLAHSLLGLHPFAYAQSPSFPLTGILDNFNRGNEGPPLSANWDIVYHGHAVQSQKAVGVHSADDNLSAWKTLFNTPIEAYLTITSNPNDSVYAFYLLHDYRQLSNMDGYECWFDTRSGVDLLHIVRVDNQVEAQLGSLINISNIAINDSVGCSVQNGVIRAWWKPAAGSWTLLGERSDTTYNGPYFIIPETWALGTWDNFGGGTVSSLSPTPASTATPTPATCAGDLNNDRVVNLSDLSIVLSNWGKTGIGDINSDGIVNLSDVAFILGRWGNC